MEKLVKLLNEYHFSGTEYIGYFLDEEENRIYFRTKVIDKGLIDEQRISNERIISKKFGFIKWLVENDKIDFEKYRIMDMKKYLHQHIIGNTCYVDIRADVPNYEFILALLAIQDKPIEFLISVLK